eukprot:g73760.t1
MFVLALALGAGHALLLLPVLLSLIGPLPHPDVASSSTRKKSGRPPEPFSSMSTGYAESQSPTDIISDCARQVSICIMLH